MATTPNTPKYRSKRENVMSYGHLLEEITVDTGVKKSVVRKVLEAAQRKSAEFLRAKSDNRVHFGRLVTFYSRMTQDRMVNHPQKPGEKIPSPAHLVVRIDAGSHLNDFLAGKKAEWDGGNEEDDEATDGAEGTAEQTPA